MLYITWKSLYNARGDVCSGKGLCHVKNCFYIFLSMALVGVAARADVMSKEATVVMLEAKQNTLTADTVKTSGSGAVVSSVTADNGVVTVEKGEIQIPVGGQNGTSHAFIWVE